jgi:hypothetical protein
MSAACHSSDGSGRVMPLGLAGDGTNLYVADSDGAVARILRRAPDGTETVLASEPGEKLYAAIATDGASVFYSFGDNDSVPRDIRRVPTSGGAPATIASAETTGFAVDDAFVFWSARDPASVSAFAGGIWRVAKSGGAPEQLAGFPNELPHGLVLHGDDVFFATYAAASNGEDLGSVIYRISKSGGVPATLSTDKGIHPVALAVTDDSVWWLDSGFTGTPSAAQCNPCGASLVKMPIAGGVATPVFDRGVHDPRALAVDEGDVWALSANVSGAELISSNGTLVRARANGVTETAASGIGFPVGVAFDATSAWVLAGNDGWTVTRIAK